MALEKIGTMAATEEVDQFLVQHGIDLVEVSANYREEWYYGAMVLALERHGSWDMADHYLNLDVSEFDDPGHAVIVIEAVLDWRRANR